MTSTIRSALFSSVLVLALVVASPASAGSVEAGIAGSDVFESCFAGTDGSCSATAEATPAGAFSGHATLTSLDSPLSRSTRYSTALARHRIGFELDAPVSEAVIDVVLQLDEASASWSQAVPEIFGGQNNPSSGARVLFQLLGHAAPSNCGCGWFIQGSSNVVPVQAREPGTSDAVSDTEVVVRMTARNAFGDGLLPAGRYEVLLRSYALAELTGAGDWGTLDAAVSGTIQDISVTTSGGGDTVDPDEPIATSLALSVNGNGANRTLTAVLTDADGAPIADRSILFYGEGESLGSAVTDGDGTASVPVTGKLRGGSRTFSAEFLGDEDYKASSATARS